MRERERERERQTDRQTDTERERDVTYFTDRNMTARVRGLIDIVETKNVIETSKTAPPP
jgi:hypothetical protein